MFSLAVSDVQLFLEKAGSPKLAHFGPWFSTGDVLQRLQMFPVVPTEGRLLASGEQRPGMLLDILQCPRCALTARNGSPASRAAGCGEASCRWDVLTPLPGGLWLTSPPSGLRSWTARGSQSPSSLVQESQGSTSYLAGAWSTDNRLSPGCSEKPGLPEAQKM